MPLCSVEWGERLMKLILLGHVGIIVSLSAHGPGRTTPPEIKAAGRAAFRDSDRLAILQEQWAACEGAWSESELYMQLKESVSHRKKGQRAWLTRHELEVRYGSKDAAQAICEAKLTEPGTPHVRDHKDCPGVDVT